VLHSITVYPKSQTGDKLQKTAVWKSKNREKWRGEKKGWVE